MTRSRAIVIVAEGLSPALLERWSAAGALPGLASLHATGTHGRFCAELVPYEPPALMTAFTGHAPGEHGCYSYWTAQSADYDARVVGGDEIGRPLLWQLPHRDRALESWTCGDRGRSSERR